MASFKFWTRLRARRGFLAPKESDDLSVLVFRRMATAVTAAK